MAPASSPATARSTSSGGWSIGPIDLVEMGTAEYDITQYQPVLYRAESVDEIVEVVGGFFSTCTDESIAAMARARRRGDTADPGGLHGYAAATRPHGAGS